MADPSETASPQPFHLAVLMTCHNRRDTTLRCLEALFTQKGLPPELQIDVFLVDDGSTDGTGDAVRTRFPQVHVLQGDGNLYWAGGMRVAWGVAARTDPDSYFWLNDDTRLGSDALARFWFWHQQMGLQNRPGILVGSTCDPEDGHLTYGGRLRESWRKPFPKFNVPPGDQLIRCDTFNGNCVWVSSGVVQRIGVLGKEFRHGAADLDYGFRATKAGISCWILPGFTSTCPLNLRGAPWTRAGLSLKERWRLILEPKGLPPASHMRLALRHGGWLGPLVAIKPYLDLLLCHFFSQESAPDKQD